MSGNHLLQPVPPPAIVAATAALPAKPSLADIATGTARTDRYAQARRAADGKCQCRRPDCTAHHVDVDQCGSSYNTVVVAKDPDTAAAQADAELMLLCQRCDHSLGNALKRRKAGHTESQEVLF